MIKARRYCKMLTFFIVNQLNILHRVSYSSIHRCIGFLKSLFCNFKNFPFGIIKQFKCIIRTFIG